MVPALRSRWKKTLNYGSSSNYGYTRVQVSLGHVANTGIIILIPLWKSWGCLSKFKQAKFLPLWLMSDKLVRISRYLQLYLYIWILFVCYSQFKLLLWSINILTIVINFMSAGRSQWNFSNGTQNCYNRQNVDSHNALKTFM